METVKGFVSVMGGFVCWVTCYNTNAAALHGVVNDLAVGCSETLACSSIMKALESDSMHHPKTLLPFTIKL